MRELLTPTEKTILKRRPQRGSFDRQTIYQILDEALICHVGFTVDEQPFVLPTAFARLDDKLFIHGSSVSRMMRALAWEKDICVTITLIDGLVLARSAFHHSMNYRSVVILGQAEFISSEMDKLVALEALTEHLAPGRWQSVRQPTAAELKATTVLALPITEASAKIRTGDPIDDESDYMLDVWAGVVPLRLTALPPVADGRLRSGIAVPEYLFRIGQSGRIETSSG